MDPRLLRYYDRELRHLQSVAQEFAREFPKIAGRLAIEDFPCADPYVERLLEGFAFLAARVQMKLDAEFPRFTQNLLETVFPHYLAPTPSMAVAQFEPDYAEGGLADGYHVPRGTVMRSSSGKGELTPCEYRTAHDLTLWPYRVETAAYHGRDLGAVQLPDTDARSSDGRPLPRARAAVRLVLALPTGMTFDKTAINDLVFFLKGSEGTPPRLYEQLLGHCAGVIVRPYREGNARHDANQAVRLDKSVMRRVGFAASEALLPYDARSFQGYRLLHEYFAFPQRFMFVGIGGAASPAGRSLNEAIRRITAPRLEVIILLDDDDPQLEGVVNAGHFAPYCTPAINLFPKRCDRIMVSDRASEFQVIPDRTKPLDFEVYRVTSVEGYGSRGEDTREFKPFFAAREGDVHGVYYAVSRQSRVLSERERLGRARSSYAGSELSLSLVDAHAVPYGTELAQLGVDALCTNRDLPIQMPVGKGRTDFSLEIGAPVTCVRVVAGPTPPKPSHAEGETAWRLVSHLSLNHLSLSEDETEHGRDGGRDAGAAGLRDLLRLYADSNDAVVRKQVESVRSVTHRPVVRRIPTGELSNPGPIAFGRGLEVTVTLDDIALTGSGAFLLGAVLEQFFARYVSVNSFTETVVKTVDRGEIMRWAAQLGDRPIL